LLGSGAVTSAQADTANVRRASTRRERWRRDMTTSRWEL
jgi:hypothetical protein